MKTLIIFLFSISILVSCKTKDPSISESAAGTYSIYGTSVNSKPVTGLTGTIKFVSKSEDGLDVTIKITFQGQTESETITGLTVKADGASDIDIYQGTGLVGTISVKELLFYYDVDNATFEFKAKK